jgi:hypothetical protein
MAQQFNAIVATQNDHFRGASAVDILQTTTALPAFRAITGSAYTVNLSGGQSGTFSVHVIGSIGGSTYIVAGLTSLGAATGNFMLYPATYAAAGTMNALNTATSIATNQVDQIVPPSTVVFESDGVANASGVSTVAVVSMVAHSSL